MPLKGADEAGLFCIMLPQPLDRSIKVLETFRPFEHGVNRDDTKPFANQYMFLAIRDRKNNSGILHTVRTTLAPAELPKIANRSGRQRSDSGQNNRASLMETVEKTPQGRLQKVAKRKQQQAIGEELETRDANKKSCVKVLTGSRMIPSVFNLSDDDTAEPPVVPNSRHSASKARSQQQTPIPQNNVPRPSPVQTAASQIVGVNTSQFTNDQARRIQFIWKVDYEGMEYDAMRTLYEANTFRGLLDTFREEAEGIPLASRQIQSNMWFLRYKLADGTVKAVIINLVSPQFELNFGRLLRGLAEKTEWKEDRDTTVEIELEAKMTGIAE